MSHSENKPKTTQTSSTNVTNLNVQDTEGVTVVGSDGVSITTTDHGALDLARDFANSALDVGVEALHMGGEYFDSAASLAGRGLDTALDATRGALDLSDAVVRSNEAVARDSMQRIADFGGVALGESLDFARDLFESAGSSLRDLTESNLEGLTGLAKQTSASADDRVTKVAMYAFLAIAAVFVLPRIFGRGAAA